MKKTLRVIGNILITLLLIFAVVMTVASVLSLVSDAGIPNIAGYGILSVQSDSMEGADGFYKGDMIVVKLIKSDEEFNQLKVNDVISFWRKQGGETYIETHRIVANTYETQYAFEVVDGVRVHNGVRVYTTKGDNTPDVDRLPGSLELDYVNHNTILAVWTGTAIPKLGTAMDFLQSQLGFFVCIILPLLAFFLYQLIHLITTLAAKKKAEALEAVADSEEAIKQKAIQEYLAQQAAQAEQPEQTPKDETQQETTE